MKNIVFILFLLVVQAGFAQIGSQLKNQLNQRKDTKINNAINKGLNQLENKAGGKKAEPKSGTAEPASEEENSNAEEQPAGESKTDEVAAPAPPSTVTISPEKAYAKFDFVPGNKVILEDDFLNETTDEIPSFWVPTSGQVEVARIAGLNTMGFIEEGTVYPRHSEVSLNSARTTLEFDYLFRNNEQTRLQAWEAGNTGSEFFTIQFARDEIYYSGTYQTDVLGDFAKRIQVYADGSVTFGSMEGKYSQGQMLTTSYGKLYADMADKWVHVSIAISERSLKVYLNSQRIINSVITKGHAPTFQFNCGNCSSETGGHQLFVKNVRIAEGGADPYKQISTSGRFIARGITFEVAKATIRPESFGALNEVVALMNSDASLKFEIGGHTDSDGDDASNLRLSQQRADAVKERLISMGIDGARLTAKGYGETKPLVTNDSPENKANNRRVEFVKN